MKTEALKRVYLFQSLKNTELELILSIARRWKFTAGQTVFREGDEGDRFYLILSGKVALEASGPGRIVRVQTLGEGDQLGWSSLLVEGGKHFQARTLEPVRALALDGARLRQVCEQDPAFGYQLMLKLLKIVAGRLQATRVQLLDLYAPHGGAKLV
jgi:CRP-like cAMP-binding protein